MKLAPGVLFPTAHTLLLIERARAGDQFVSREIFDGGGGRQCRARSRR